MEDRERARIDRLTESVYHLLKGRIPEMVPVADDPEDEIRQLAGKINELIGQFRQVREFIDPLSQGRLDVSLPRGNFLASPFKQLHASLGHLTWQTQRIAGGDFSQRVDFMGDFSLAFNAMVDALSEARSQMLAESERYKKLAELKNHYLHVMAHDIRTPIGAIMGFADILLDADLPPAERRHATVIKRNCDSLLALINNILDMARLENRKVEIAALPFSPRELCEEIRELISARLHPGVRFLLTADPSLPDRLMGDAHRLRQVLVNLAGNAAKFTKAGDIRLILEQTGERSECLLTRFSVADTGIGIAENRLEEIFSPFTQADGSIASRFGGTGLGLAISRELVGLMGGALAVKSRLGRGTEFFFTLPLKEACDIRTGADEINICRFRCHILVVDDDMDSLRIIQRILENQGVRHSLCQDSTRAIDALGRALDRGDPFTLAWLDIDMPKLNGLELAARIRADQRFSRLRLVACTAHVEQMADAGGPSPFSFVATKPVTPAALARIMEEASATYPGDRPACDLSGRRALVVDDNPINRFLIKNLMRKLDVAVEEAENGQICLDRLAVESFDIVIMDRMMPVMDGETAIRRMRRDPALSGLPILAFTADGPGETDNSLMAAGADAILAKPIDLDNMVDIMCAALEANRPRPMEADPMKADGPDICRPDA